MYRSRKPAEPYCWALLARRAKLSESAWQCKHHTQERASATATATMKDEDKGEKNLALEHVYLKNKMTH